MNVGRAEYEKLKVILREQEDGVETVIAQLTSIERKLKGKKNKSRRKLFQAELKYFENQKSACATQSIKGAACQ